MALTEQCADGRIPLRRRADGIWHSDVCHGPAIKIGDRSFPLRIHALLDDHSLYAVRDPGGHDGAEAVKDRLNGPPGSAKRIR
jgi:hypothetical protein